MFLMQYLVNSSQSTNSQNKKQAPHWEIVSPAAKLERVGSRRRLLQCLWWTSRRRKKKSWSHLGREMENNLGRETQNKRKNRRWFEEERTRQRRAGTISQPIGSDLGVQGWIPRGSRQCRRMARLLFGLYRQRAKKG